MIRRVSVDDLAGPQRYAAMRDGFRRRIIELKRDRRIAVGDKVTLVFENFDTVLFQIQEMLHVERISDIDRVRDEIDVYNELLPSERELSATMLIEITDQDSIESELGKLIGIDEAVSIIVAGRSFAARFEPGRSTEEKLSAVQYIRFPVDEQAMRDLATPGARVEIAIAHPNYAVRVALSESQRESLAADFRA
jgi:uncharacterized protein DUF3501